MNRIRQIREKEKASHIQTYSGNALYQEGSWLEKPIRTVLELLPCFADHSSFRGLDLGCGVGRNCLAIAQHFHGILCHIDCVDILDLAIEKLTENARLCGVADNIHGIVLPLEDFPIPPETYDLILAVSALEHIDTKESFIGKLAEIRDGIRENGIACFVINSNVQEFNRQTGMPLPAQFEVNLPTETLQALLTQCFDGWEILKYTVRHQQYDIPRGSVTAELHTSVVTFVARNR